MHPALALLIAITAATTIVGAVMLIAGMRHAPELLETETDFWLLDETANNELAPIPVQPLDAPVSKREPSSAGL